jgi:ribosomal protein S12 methylthiotransferase accessory factor
VLQWQPKLLVAPAKSLDVHVDLQACDMFHADQRAVPGFAFAPVDDSTPLAWVQAYSLTRSRHGFLPATLADLYHKPRTAGDRFDSCPVSGYACGNSLEEALLGGVCEVVERDAFMIAWYQRLTVPSLDLASLTSPEARDALRRFAPAPVRLYCSDITTDIGIPAVLVMMTSRAPGWPAASVATASDMSIERAVVKALCELSSGHWLCRAEPNRSLSMREVQAPEDHGLFYAQAAALPNLDLFLRPRSVRRVTTDAAAEVSDVKALLDTAVQRLAERGLESWAVELTPPAIAAEGLRVVKVVVPGLQPIDFGFTHQHLGGKRLYEAPRVMGYRSLATSPAALNPAPHPFP